MLLTQQVRDGMCFVQLHLDPERKADPFSTLPRALILHGQPGAAPVKETMTLQWKNADLLEAAIPVAGGETVLNTIEIPGQQPVTLPPACLPYSPEFAPDQPGRGAMALAQIAVTTGGGERIEIPKIWSELPIKSRYVELAPWLLVGGAILFLLEIFERRTGWLLRPWVHKNPARAVEEKPARPVTQAAPAAKPVFPWLVRKPSRQTTAPGRIDKESTSPDSPTSAAPMPTPAKSADGITAIEALQKARERARRRSDKDP
jgi:hypothetical protein